MQYILVNHLFNEYTYFQALQFSKLQLLLPKGILFYCKITTFLHVNKKWPFLQNPVACWVCFCPWRLLFWFPCFPMCISSLRPFSSVRTIFRIRSEWVPLRGPVNDQYLIGGFHQHCTPLSTSTTTKISCNKLAKASVICGLFISCSLCDLVSCKFASALLKSCYI